MTPIKNIKEVTEPLKEQILKGDVHTIDEMKAWLKPLGYSDPINEAAINFILREFVMSKVPSGNLCNAEMIVEHLRPLLKHQPSAFIHQTSSPSSRLDWIERSIYESEYMNIERFHNEFAMRLEYERIVKDKRSTISFEESDETCVILTLQSGEVITINPSDKLNSVNVQQFIKAK